MAPSAGIVPRPRISDPVAIRHAPAAVVTGSCRCLVISLALLVLAGCGRSGTDAKPLADGSFQQVPCWFDNAGANPATCAWLRPSLQDSTGSTALPVVVLHELPRQPSERVVIYLNGGPGGSTGLDVDGMRSWRMLRAHLGLRHDLVLYDQRGSGRALPDLSCPTLDQAARRSLGEDRDQNHAVRSQQFAEAVLDCAQAVPLADRRSAVYSTATAVEDLGELIANLRTEFGYRSVLLYGASYGARLAVMATQSSQIEIDGMVLDSLYVPGGNSTSLYPQELEALLDAFDGQCMELGCELPEGGIRVSLRSAMDHLREQPLFAEAADPDSSGRRLAIRLDPEDLVGVVISSLYLTDWMAAIPGMLEDLVHDGIDEDWQSLLDNTAWMSLKHGVNHVAYSLIDCRDNEPLDPRKMEVQLARYPLFEDLLRPADWEYTYCDRLAVPAAPLPTDWQVRTPTLLLNMAVDPATPADQVEAVIDRFDDAELVIVPGSGHGVLGSDQMTALRAGWFLNGDPVPEMPWRPQMCPPPGGEPFTA